MKTLSIANIWSFDKYPPNTRSNTSLLYQWLTQDFALIAENSAHALAQDGELYQNLLFMELNL